MSDFFDAFGGDLHRAARRRVRRARVVTAAGTLAVVAALAALVVPAIGTEDPEREVAAPVNACGGEPPREILDRYAVLRRPATADDIPPPQFGAGLAKTWTDAARMAREVSGYRFWLVPALRGTCDKPAPAICIVIPGEAACGDTPGDVSIRVGDRWLTAAGIPDGGDPFLRVDGRNVEGDVEGNVFVASYEARDPGEVILDEGWTEYAPLPDCGTAVSTQRPAPDVLIDQFAILRGDTPSAEVPKDFAVPGVARIFPAAARSFDALGESYALLPALLWNGKGCDDDDTVPGLCVLEAGKQTVCANLAEIRRRALVLRDRDSAVTIVPDDMSEDGTNVVSGRP